MTVDHRKNSNQGIGRAQSSSSESWVDFLGAIPTPECLMLNIVDLVCRGIAAVSFNVVH